MNKAILKTLLISTVLTGSLTLAASAASIGGATVEASALNLRAAANTQSSIYTTLPRGAALVVGEKTSPEWYKVVYRGAVGYVASEYVRFYETLDANLGGGEIRGSSVRLRSESNTSSAILGTYNNGTEMNVQGVTGNWYKVNYNGTNGYVHSDYFALNGGRSDLYTGGTTTAPIPPDNEVSSDGETIVETAMKYMGVPYVWAGTSPNGFDCSGFVYYVYKENGYSINRTAASIYQNGVPVDRDSLQIGDAICFGASASYIGHVGIYIGDGEFIHASSGSGQVVISGLDESYYNRNYFGARRIV